MTKRKPPAGTTGAALTAHYTGWAADEGVQLDPSDVALLERLARATDAVIELDKALSSGVTETGPTGAVKVHPALSARRAEVEQIARLVVLLDRRIEEASAGLDPADRPGVRGVKPFETRGSYGPRSTGTDGTASALPRREHHSRAGGRRPGNGGR
ncbi:P27 family phage terminase small subunit [Tsukamurella asaccharolytica]|uniref:P27 family phage terminase small subunit n=1 Tax=Tsukamurella asaccharolytica TaxID=2592067 RepID=A0A5C5R9Q1_9ACTN|nr:P27 family phage terminase small subunit [Tsukamurella asaccharolytica]TWS19392.1 P27 family phage terminase small subunit [Tsukamurella asaccharolytica]